MFEQAQQWVDEVREKTPQLRVALYHGSKRRSFTPALLACHDVIVTTYQTMANECDAAPKGALFRVRWHRYACLAFASHSCQLKCGTHMGTGTALAVLCQCPLI